MRKFLLLFSLFFLTIPVLVSAQGELAFSTVNVDLWPEYDDPAVLVVYKILLPEDTILPMDVSVRIPAGARVNAVAVGSEGGALLNATYSKETSDDWIELTISATSYQLQIEYYDSLITNESSRRYLYQWLGDYAVGSFSVVFQQPLDSTDLTFSPAAEFLGVDQYELSYYFIQAGSLEKGQTFTFNFEYQKTTDRLSTTGMHVEAVEPLSTNGNQGSSLTNSWQQVVGFLGGLDIKLILITLAVLIVVLIVVVLVLIFKHNPTASKSQVSRKGRGLSGDSSESPYCTQCGRRGQPGDRFCRVCGTRLKFEE